ncbi:HsdM family class I SAM-dependent methyltransferase [Caminibacter pacificus]
MIEIERKIKDVIDDLKSVCANFGLGNDGNEFKVITQIFLYKYLNDQFLYTLKQMDEFKKFDDVEKRYKEMDDNERALVRLQLGNVAYFEPEHLLSSVYQKQNEKDFAKDFDDTLETIAANNADIFSVKTDSGAKIRLFDRLSEFITDPSKRNNFIKALINKLINVSFEEMFHQKYDFYATIFEYLIKDYNNDSGGKYAEYYTPHMVASIMAELLVEDEVRNVKCYDPSAGSGTLLMNLAHKIGEDKCTIYSQDISQKSTHLLRLNLVLNNLIHSISNIVQGNTLLNPAHMDKRFEFIVSNPPFKMDFSDYRDLLESEENKERFFAGVPKVPNKKKESMAIYLLFIQHIMYMLKEKGRAAIVVPTGFLTATSSIEKKIRQKIVEEGWLRGVISMPSNIFATTGTNVSIVFLAKERQKNTVLIDASKLGSKIKDGKKQRNVLSKDEENRIINVFKEKKEEKDFSVVVDFDEIKEKNYSFSAGQYFDIEIEHVDITKEEFEEKMKNYQQELSELFAKSKELENEIMNNFEKLIFKG